MENKHGVIIDYYENDEVCISYTSPEGITLEIEVEKDDYETFDDFKPDELYVIMLREGDLWIDGLVISLAGRGFYTPEELNANPLIEASNFTQDFAIQSRSGGYCKLVPTSTFRSTQDIINYFKEED